VPILEKKGYKVKLVEFNDYVQPNLALAQGSLDANFFQHQVYLKKFAADQKLDIAELVQGPDRAAGRLLDQAQDAGRREGRRPRHAAERPEQPGARAGAAGAEQAGHAQEGIDPLRASEKDVARTRRS
jgi:D-methionine transport system substrate-binding protein